MEYAKETRTVILKKPGKSVAKRKIYKLHVTYCEYSKPL